MTFVAELPNNVGPWVYIKDYANDRMYTKHTGGDVAKISSNRERKQSVMQLAVGMRVQVLSNAELIEIYINGLSEKLFPSGFTPEMQKEFCNRVVTIREVRRTTALIFEDSGRFSWDFAMFKHICTPKNNILIGD